MNEKLYENWVPTKEACRIMDVSREFLRRHKDEPGFPKVRRKAAGGHTFYLLSDLERYQRDRAKAPATPRAKKATKKKEPADEAGPAVFVSHTAMDEEIACAFPGMRREIRPPEPASA